MAYSETLASRIRDHLRHRTDIEEKRLFGGVGFLLDGNMLVGVWKQSLIVRLAIDEGEAALQEWHVRPFDITGRAMRGWVMVEPAGVADNASLNDWIDRAVAFVETLPAK